MTIPTIKELVVNNQRVYFHHYVAGELWYEHENGFQFPVPSRDTGLTTFYASDKALFFMRWMREYLKQLEKAQSLGI